MQHFVYLTLLNDTNWIVRTANCTINTGMELDALILTLQGCKRECLLERITITLGDVIHPYDPLDPAWNTLLTMIEAAELIEGMHAADAYENSLEDRFEQEEDVYAWLDEMEALGIDREQLHL